MKKIKKIYEKQKWIKTNAGTLHARAYGRQWRCWCFVKTENRVYVCAWHAREMSSMLTMVSTFFCFLFFFSVERIKCAKLYYFKWKMWSKYAENTHTRTMMTKTGTKCTNSFEKCVLFWRFGNEYMNRAYIQYSCSCDDVSHSQHDGAAMKRWWMVGGCNLQHINSLVCIIHSLAETNHLHFVSLLFASVFSLSLLCIAPLQLSRFPCLAKQDGCEWNKSMRDTIHWKSEQMHAQKM